MEPVFEAVLTGESEVGRLLRDDPGIVRTRAARDHLVEAIPHWLYAGDTGLHLAAQPTGAGGTAGALEEQLEIIDLLLRHGADPAAADAARLEWCLAAVRQAWNLVHDWENTR